jgi:hypothetical protein
MRVMAPKAWAVACWLTGLAAAAGAEAFAATPGRVAFVNAASDGAGAAAAIAAAWSRLDAAGAVARIDEPARALLEAGAVAPEVLARRGVEHARSLLGDARKSPDAAAGLALVGEAEAELLAVATRPDVVVALADVAITLGEASVDRGDESAAAERFLLAVRLVPGRTTLDPGLYRPSIVKRYVKAVKLHAKKTPKARRARLDVTTEPPGAEVWIDGRSAGVTPLALDEIDVGDHYITLTIDGRAARGARVALSAPGTALAYDLGAAHASASLETLRERLAAGGAGDAAWLESALALAGAIGASTLVVVRGTGPGDAVAVDATAARAGEPFALADSARLAAAVGLPPVAPVSLVAAGPAPASGGTSDAATLPADPPRPAPRGRVPGIVAGTLVAAVLVAVGVGLGVGQPWRAHYRIDSLYWVQP